MSQYIIRRILGMIPLLIGISFLVFALVNLVPGSPTDQFEFDPNIRPEDLQRIQENLGLDEPWYARYFSWLIGAVQGDFGIGLRNYVPVTIAVGNALPNTLVLSVSSLILALLFSIPVGIIAAVRRNGLFDRITTIFAVIFFSAPTIWVGMMAIIVFAVQFNAWGLPSLPVAGATDLRNPDAGLLTRLRYLVMPATTLALVSLAGWTRYIRSQMLEVIRQDYVRTAQAKGLKTRDTLTGHAFRNAMLPLVTLVGFEIPALFSGAIVVERVFGYQGIGMLTITSLNSNDYNTAMACVMMLALLTVIGNLVADILYGVFDPRVRYD